MQKHDFYYELPPERIAQTPLAQRDASRMMVVSRIDGAIRHQSFRDLPDFLQPGDCLILNDTRVLPARLYGKREDTGAVVEFLLLKNLGNDRWEVLCGPGKKARAGHRFTFGGGLLAAEVERVQADGNRVARFTYDGDFFAVLAQIGEMPLPHYITETLAEPERYQTVYAREQGSAAAPTAGLHFTPQLLENLRSQGVGIGYVTLHVGLGTFRPVKTETIEEHHMHTEQYTLPQATVDLIAKTKQRGGRVIAVGTTCCRTLESVARTGELTAGAGETDIFMYPGFPFRCIDGLLTNFHLPESTLIMLVSAFLGHKETMEAYRVAVEEKYRFYSFGDCMLIV